MKEEIQKVLEMNKTGVISDEQAAILLEELARGSQAKTEASAESKEGKERKTDPTGEAVRQFFKSTFQSAFAGAFGAADGNRNSMNMSKVETPSGADFIFEDNSINVSAVSDLHLQRAEFSHNSVNASKIRDLKIEGGLLKDCAFHGSSIQDIELRDSECVGLEVHGSKFNDWQLRGGSRLEKNRFMGSVCKDLIMQDQSRWSGTSASGTHLSDWNIKSSHLENLRMEGVHATDLNIVGSELNACVVRAIQFDDVSFDRCHFRDVLFTGKESWMRQGYSDVAFENCRLEKLLFADCRFKDVTFRNIDMKDREIRNLSLTDQVIDGNEALLKLIQGV